MTQTDDAKRIRAALQTLVSSIEELEPKAESGDALAQLLLGSCYYYGECGAEQSYEEAVFWYQKAAEQGLVVAQNILGTWYIEEIGCPKDYKKAVFWWSKAAEQGDAESQYKLGYCYEHGLGVKKDQQKSAYWYQKAKEQGYSES